MEWTKDANGDVLRKLKKNNVDFESKYEVDFSIDFDHWPLTEAEEKYLLQSYPNAEIMTRNSDFNVGRKSRRRFPTIVYSLFTQMSEGASLFRPTPAFKFLLAITRVINPIIYRYFA